MSVASRYDDKERVRESVDIVDLIGAFLPLKRQGRNYVALCPWHDDSRPSLQVNPQRQTWKCWVCNDGGDIFSFVQKKEGVDFRESLEILADRAGITLHRSGSQDLGATENRNAKNSLFAIMRWAADQYHHFLIHSADAKSARDYLVSRGISEQSIRDCQIGFAPHQWQWLTSQGAEAGHSQKSMESVGLVIRSDKNGKFYDRYRGRVIFPIRDTQSRTVALGGRILPELSDDRSPKYINSPETRLFSKSDQLYGLDLSRDAIAKHKQSIVVEGYTDVVMARQHGVDNVVAVLGTALGQRHVRLLRRYADQITLILDGDEAGQSRTNEVLDLFVAEQVDLRVLTLPDKMDPCDFVATQGAEQFRAMIGQAVDALEHKIRVETQGFDPNEDLHRANLALEKILGTLSRSPRLQSDTDSTKRLREQQILARLSREFQIPETEVRQRLTTLRRSAGSSRNLDQVDSVIQSTLVRQLDAWDCELLEILLQQPETVATAVESIPVEQVSEGPARLIFSKFHELNQAQKPVDFHRLLTELEDARLKSYLVELDEHAQQKADRTSAAPEERLKGLIDSIGHRQLEREHVVKLTKLEKRGMNHEEGMELLHHLIDQQRKQQGTSGPTDG